MDTNVLGLEGRRALVVGGGYGIGRAWPSSSPGRGRTWRWPTSTWSGHRRSAEVEALGVRARRSPATSPTAPRPTPS